MVEKHNNFFKNRKNHLLDIDWWDVNFMEKFLYSKSEFKDKLNEKRIRLDNKIVSSRVINHWQERDLLSDDRPNGKGWRKFSISEVIWLEIIINLRKFGMDFEKIKKVKSYLETFYRKESPSKFPELDFFILVVLKFKKPIKLIVFDSGEAILSRQIDIDIAKQIKILTNDYISIDLNRIVMKGFKNNKNTIDYLDYAKTQIEKEIQQSFYLDDVRSLSIKTINGDEFIIDKEFILESEREMKILLNKLKYAEATTSKRNKKTVHKLTVKKKIKK